MKPSIDIVVTPIEVAERPQSIDDDIVRVKKSQPLIGHTTVIEKRADSYIHDIDSNSHAKKDSKDLEESDYRKD
jgi:hypothetical protein